ncbi:hypothetical protein [Streptomyces sp. CB03911]|uniref:hypothetical protein n=1 Tax=Streptomyces sp. CB03911 TaxID=1804758 RepID=UPI00093BBE1F|nr:hypothetical protein [Streptomyces sp. CB03911]OKI19266.1 hypothetical protein A6A07_07130 [Streptomyces sp. CB03911]
MEEIKAQCRASSGDYIVARKLTESVELAAYEDGTYRMEAYLAPDPLRTFARGLLAMADEIDGGEAKPAVANPFKVGVCARVVTHRPDGADLEIGDAVTVVSVDGPDEDDTIRVRVLGGRRRWSVTRADLEVVIPDEPAPSARAQLLEQATALLPHPASADDLLRVAEYLAG